MTPKANSAIASRQAALGRSRQARTSDSRFWAGSTSGKSKRKVSASFRIGSHERPRVLRSQQSRIIIGQCANQFQVEVVDHRGTRNGKLKPERLPPGVDVASQIGIKV